jgi:hypothetical protein
MFRYESQTTRLMPKKGSSNGVATTKKTVTKHQNEVNQLPSNDEFNDKQRQNTRDIPIFVDNTSTPARRLAISNNDKLILRPRSSVKSLDCHFLASYPIHTVEGFVGSCFL